MNRAHQFKRLVRELAELTPGERARLVAQAARMAKSLPHEPLLRAPTLSGGTTWIAGSLRREDLHGDDGR